jgi:hypothetical protein
MREMTAVGLHLAKKAFQVHGIDAEEKIIARRPLRRGDVRKFVKACPRVWWDGRLAERPTTRPGDSSAGAYGEPYVASLRPYGPMD